MLVTISEQSALTILSTVHTLKTERDVHVVLDRRFIQIASRATRELDLCLPAHISLLFVLILTA